MDYKNIIEKLSLIRTERKLSSRAFGRMLGNSDTYFYKIENGSIILTLPKFLEVLDALEVTPEEFFWQDLQKYEEQKNLIKNFEKLSSESKETILKLISNLK